MKNRNTPNLEWDELDDIDAMLNDSSAKVIEGNVKTNDNVQTEIVINKDILENSSNDLNVGKKKKRRRSELIAQGLEVDVPVMGYSERSKRLNNGQELTIDDADVSDSKTEFNRLFAKGVYLLGMREHSIQEMTDKLNARSESVDVVLAVVDELVENNFLSDERFAESYVRSRQNKGFGPVKIRSEFHAKGITNRLAEEHINANSPEWIDVAREQYEKKYGVKALDSYKEWTKRARFMQGRGFTMEHIQAVMPSADFY